MQILLRMLKLTLPPPLPPKRKRKKAKDVPGDVPVYAEVIAGLEMLADRIGIMRQTAASALNKDQDKPPPQGSGDARDWAAVFCEDVLKPLYVQFICRQVGFFDRREGSKSLYRNITRSFDTTACPFPLDLPLPRVLKPRQGKSTNTNPKPDRSLAPLPSPHVLEASTHALIRATPPAQGSPEAGVGLSSPRWVWARSLGVEVEVCRLRPGVREGFARLCRGQGRGQSKGQEENRKCGSRTRLPG